MPLKAPTPHGNQDADDLEAESAAEEEIECREDLRKLGAEFSEHPPLADVVVGCLVINPVTLKSLGKAIKLSPEAVLNFTVGRHGHFMQDIAAPSPGEPRYRTHRSTMPRPMSAGRETGH